MASDYNLEQEIVKLQRLFGHIDIPTMLQYIGIEGSAADKQRSQNPSMENSPAD